MDGMDDYYMVEEMLCGAERGAICFTFSILRIFTGRFGGFGLVCVCLFCFVLVWPVEILHSVSVSLFCGFPVVDRPCPVLARQCRKKKRKKAEGCHCILLHVA